jgi:quercetin dioxygenase-like cupin family protein
MSPEPISILHIKKDWNTRGFSCGIWKDPPGQEWKDNVHDAESLILLLEGTLELEIKGEKSRPNPGEEVRIPMNVPHTVRNVGRIPCRWLYGIKEK